MSEILAVKERFSAGHPALDGRNKKMLIGGRWVDAVSGQTFDSVNPSNGRVLARIALGDAADVDAAVKAARSAFEGPWRKVKPYERQHLLLKMADIVDAHFEELAYLDSLDFGGPLSRTLASRRRALGMLRYYAGMATALHGETIENSIPGNFLSYTLKEPIGVVGSIIPWNSPVGSALWKVAPALAAGCTVVLKPSEEASLGPLRLVELLLEAGLPDGVLNVVTGAGQAGAALAAHPDVDKIAFTGSTATGQSIIRASADNVKKVSLELGGKSPNIVFADADLDAAVPVAAMAAFANTGQICSAGTRLFVERSVYDEFLDRVADFSRTVRIGDSLDPEAQLGPLVSKKQLDRVSGYFDVAREEGVKVLAGGERITDGGLADGYFVSPTVFGGVVDTMRVSREEIFGPVVSALPFDDLDEVVRRGNDTNFGLGSGVWTRDIGKANRVAAGLRAGTVWVNCYQHLDPAIPFGGYKMSGYGRESGVRHVEEYLATKAVIVNND